jgi:dinuclear metal center YbgI/SA1388 family protein
MKPKVTDVIEIINKIAPFAFAEEWDNSGLQVGDPGLPVSRIMISLDPGCEAIESAIDKKCQLLLTHHPFLFHPSKVIDTSLPAGSLLKLAIKNDLSIISLHTNYDIAEAGINDILAAQIGLQSCSPLKITGWEELLKLTVFVPLGFEEKVLEALFRFSGFIGNYSDCSFQSRGIGSFKPLDGAVPFIGKVDSREFTDETRIEVLVRREDMQEALTAMLKVHPYEEPAYDLFPLINKGKCRGLGRIGELDESVTLRQFAERIKKDFSLGGLRVTGDLNRKVKKVAVCGGSGSSLICDAAGLDADVLITGDIKYHDAKDAQALELALVDIGHFSSEVLMIKGVSVSLRKVFALKGFEVEVLSCESERDPFVFF